MGRVGLVRGWRGLGVNNFGGHAGSDGVDDLDVWLRRVFVALPERQLIDQTRDDGVAAGRFKGGGVDLDRDAIAQADRLPGPADDHCPALFPRVRRGVPGKFEQKGLCAARWEPGEGFGQRPFGQRPAAALNDVLFRQHVAESCTAECSKCLFVVACRLSPT